MFLGAEGALKRFALQKMVAAAFVLGVSMVGDALALAGRPAYALLALLFALCKRLIQASTTSTQMLPRPMPYGCPAAPANQPRDQKQAAALAALAACDSDVDAASQRVADRMHCHCALVSTIKERVRPRAMRQSRHLAP